MSGFKTIELCGNNFVFKKKKSRDEAENQINDLEHKEARNKNKTITIRRKQSEKKKMRIV